VTRHAEGFLPPPGKKGSRAQADNLANLTTTFGDDNQLSNPSTVLGDGIEAVLLKPGLIHTRRLVVRAAAQPAGSPTPGKTTHQGGHRQHWLAHSGRYRLGQFRWRADGRRHGRYRLVAADRAQGEPSLRAFQICVELARASVQSRLDQHGYVGAGLYRKKEDFRNLNTDLVYDITVTESLRPGILRIKRVPRDQRVKVTRPPREFLDAAPPDVQPFLTVPGALSLAVRPNRTITGEFAAHMWDPDVASRVIPGITIIDQDKPTFTYKTFTINDFYLIEDFVPSPQMSQGLRVALGLAEPVGDAPAAQPVAGPVAGPVVRPEPHGLVWVGEAQCGQTPMSRPGSQAQVANSTTSITRR
jgi:hypothetical protein